MNVEKAKFFVDKLKIRVLPAVICFKNGIVIDRSVVVSHDVTAASVDSA